MEIKLIKQSDVRQKQYKDNIFFIIFVPKVLSMTLQKWIEDRAIHGFPTFSVEDVRAAGLCSSEQILQNELYRQDGGEKRLNYQNGIAMNLSTSKTIHLYNGYSSI